MLPCDHRRANEDAEEPLEGIEAADVALEEAAAELGDNALQHEGDADDADEPVVGESSGR